MTVLVRVSLLAKTQWPAQRRLTPIQYEV